MSWGTLDAIPLGLQSQPLLHPLNEELEPYPVPSWTPFCLIQGQNFELSQSWTSDFARAENSICDGFPKSLAELEPASPPGAV
jgi:hypothetical protein